MSYSNCMTSPEQLNHNRLLASIAYLPRPQAITRYRAMGYEVYAPQVRDRLEEFYFLMRDRKLTVTIAGTNEFFDWLRNLAAMPRMIFHSGYNRAALSIIGEISKYVDAKRNSIDHLNFVGHSKGGAVAGILTFMHNKYEKEGIGVTGYGFDSPRFMNREARQLYNHDSFYRVFQPGDLVPHVPAAMLGFGHCGQAITLSPEGNYAMGDCYWEEAKVAYPLWYLLFNPLKSIKIHMKTSGLCKNDSD